MFLRILRDPDAPIYQVRDGMITVKRARVPYQAEGRLLHHPQADGPASVCASNGAGDLFSPRKPQPSLQKKQRLGTVDVIAHIMATSGTGGAGGSPVYVRWHELWAYRPGQAGRGDRQLPRHRDRQVRRSDHAGELPDVVQLGDAFQVREDGWAYAGLHRRDLEAAWNEAHCEGRLLPARARAAASSLRSRG